MSIRKNVVAVACGMALAASVSTPAFAVDYGNVSSNEGKSDVNLAIAQQVIDPDNPEKPPVIVPPGEKPPTPEPGPDPEPGEPKPPVVVQQLKFSTPTTVGFAVTGEGELVAAKSSIQNMSIFPIHVDNVKVEAEAAWNLVSKADIENPALQTQNALWFYFDTATGDGETNDDVNSYAANKKEGEKVVGLNIADVASKDKWQIPAKKGETVGKCEFTPKGKVVNPTAEIAEKTVKAATVTWTLASGNFQ